MWQYEKDDPARLIFAIATELGAGDLVWLKTRLKDSKSVKELLDRIEQDSDSIFIRDTFSRCLIIESIATSLNQKAPSCDFRNFAAMPPAATTGKSPGGSDTDSKLHLFRTYCSSCHGAGPINFLEGDDTTILARLKQDAAIHLKRLDWEATTSRSMPPANSEPRRRLEAAPQDRKKMLETLEELLGSG
jgi:hypothetical protein